MIRSNDYQKLFQIELKYLVSDIFAQHYKTLECLLICDNGLWTSYLPKKIIDKTLQDGEKLYRSDESFKKFRNDFNLYTLESKVIFEDILSNDLSRENANKFLLTVSVLWSFYSKTEFFYTDNVVPMKTDEVLARNIKELEKIKNEGRAFLNSLIFEDNNYLVRFLRKVSEKFSILLEDLNFYSINEIIGLFNNQIVQAETVLRRREFFFMRGESDRILYGDGKNSRGNFSDFLALEESQLKGTVANRGVVKGRVKVFPQSYYSDFSMLTKLFDEMEYGDILVAETTSPELILACQKAGAILTNQGGLLSHASIISRELNIPCIVGLGNVTQVLSDGDFVEVDAERGIIRLINK